MKDWQVFAVDQLEIQYEWQGWKVHSTWPVRGRRQNEIHVLLTVEWQGAGPQIVMATSRINLYSVSAMGGIEVAMRKVPAADKEAVHVFLQSVKMNMLEWYRQGRAVENPDPEKAAELSGWIIYPIWPFPGVVGIAAAPDSFKSILAEAIALQIQTGNEILRKNTRRNANLRKILYLDWESGPGRFASRLGAICRGAELDVKPWLTYQHLTAPLADAVGGLVEDILKYDIDAVIIDSMSAAIGGPLTDDEAVSAFYDAVRRLDVPTLVLAHKSAENIRKRATRFFGSIMSEVRLRMAWNAERVGDTVVWECFKDNDAGMNGKKLAWDIHFHTIGEEDERQLQAIQIYGTNPHHVEMPTEQPGGGVKPIPRWKRIVDDILDNGPATSDEIAHRMSDDTAKVRSELSRRNEFRKLADGLLWGLND
ncbi:MAG: AAA family ATPase [bacterium]|nr:AAA family ATPase [bacterium]